MNMLDAVIAVLEIIVAMEDLKDLDINGDLTLDLTELGIEVDSNDPQKITKVDTTLKATVDKLLNLKQTVDGETSILKALSISTGKAEVNLQEFLENYNNVEWLSEKGFTADTYRTLFSNLYKLATDPTWADGEGTIEDFFSKWANLNWGDLTVTARTGNYTLKLTDEGSIKIDWEHANYKNL